METKQNQNSKKEKTKKKNETKWAKRYRGK